MMNQNIGLEETATNEPTIEEMREIERYNWGAFFFWWIWGAFNGAFLETFIPWLGIVIASFIPFVNILAGLAAIGFMIYFGFKGNKWAWENKKWRSPKQFIKAQKAWAIAALIIFLLNISITIIFLILGFTFAKTLKNTSPDSIMAKTFVLTFNFSPELKNAPDGNTLAEKLVKELQSSKSSDKYTSYSLYNSNTIAISRYDYQTQQNKISELYSFTKKSNSCSIPDKNCYILSYEVKDNKIIPTMKTYFDSKGKTKDVSLRTKKK